MVLTAATIAGSSIVVGSAEASADEPTTADEDASEIALPSGASDTAGAIADELVVDLTDPAKLDALTTGTAEDLLDDPVGVLQSVSGVRTDATTILAGGLIAGDGALPGTIELSDLPAGMTIVGVRPDAEHALDDGRRWDCTSTACQLSDADGNPIEVEDGDIVEILLVMSEPTSPHDANAVSASLAGMGPRRVDLDRADGESPEGSPAVGLSVSGPAFLGEGEVGEIDLSAVYLGDGPLDGAEIVVSGLDSGAASAQPVGDGWTCEGDSCRRPGNIEPYTVLPSITLSYTAPTDVDDTETVTIPMTVRASRGETTIDGEYVHTIEVGEHESDEAYITAMFQRSSLLAPASQSVDLEVGPTGAGESSDDITVTGTARDGVTLDWAAAIGDGTWSCDASGCVLAEGALVGEPATLNVPVDVAAETPEGVVEATFTAQVGQTPIDPDGPETASTTFVVGRPNAPELTTSVRRSDPDAGPAPAGTNPGAQTLTFVPNEARSATIDVVNSGNRYAPTGSIVHVQLQSDDTGDDRIEELDASWTCRLDGDDVTAPLDVPAGATIACSQALTTDMHAGDGATFSFTLAATTSDVTNWSVLATIDDDDISDDHQLDFVIETVALGPTLTASFESAERPRVGTTSAMRLTVTNQGTLPASEQFVMVESPASVEVVAADGDGWTCAQTDIVGAAGSTMCARSDELAVAAATTLDLQLQVVREPAPDAALWAWTDAPGQRPTGGARGGFTYPLDPAAAASVSAGDDIVVVSPTRGPDGTVGPATVTLHGTADLTSRGTVSWQQRCVEGSDPDADCAGTAPAVTWVDAPDTGSTSTTATFRLPDLPERPTDSDPLPFHFELRAGEASDTVTVNVFAPTTDGDLPDDDDDDSDGGGESDSGGTDDDSGGSSDDGGDDGDDSPDTQPFADVVAPPTLDVIAASTTVDTRGRIDIWADVESTQDLTFEWEQVDGRDADLADGARDDSNSVSYVAPDLQPGEESIDLEFQVTVTDDLGQSAHGNASFSIVWPDDGLTIEVADGADTLVTQIGHPVAVGATATSAGGPYTWAWSVVDGADVLAGVESDRAVVSFDAPAATGAGELQATVTDSFGRTATDRVRLEFTAYDPSQLPAGLCEAADALANGQTATLANPDNTFSLTIGTASGSFACDATLDIEFQGAAARLPGGVVLDAISGRAGPVGIEIDSASATFPAPWNVPATGLERPLGIAYAADAALGALTGTIDVAVLPFAALDDSWTTSAGIAYGAQPVPFDPPSVDPPAGIRMLPAAAAPSDSSVPPTTTPPTTTPPTTVAPTTTTPAPEPTTPDPTTTTPDDDQPLVPLDPDPGQLNPPHPTQVVTFHGAADSADGTGAVVLDGRIQPGGAADYAMQATGVAVLADVDVPLDGSITTGPDGSPQWNVGGGIEPPASLASGLRLDDLVVRWDGGGISGSAAVVAVAPPAADGTDEQTAGDGPRLALAIDYPIDASPTAQVTSSQPWTVTGDGPGLTFDGTAGGRGSDFQLSATGSTEWAIAHDVTIDDLEVSIDTTCATGDCTTAVGLTATATVLGTDGVTLGGDVDLATNSWDLTGETGELTVVDGLAVGPDVAIEVTFDDDGLAAFGGGAVDLAGDQRDAEIWFGPDATVLTAQLGDQEPTPGWRFRDVTLAVATADTEFAPDGGGDLAAVTVPLAANRITGVAEFTLPERYTTSGMLPDEVTHGLATFEVDPDGTLDATTYTLDVPSPDGWFLAGDHTSPVAVEVIDFGYDLTIDGTTVTAHVRGSTGLSTAAIAGTDRDAVELGLDGSLATSGDDAVLTAQLSSRDDTETMADAFALTGLTLDDVGAHLRLTPDSRELAFTADAGLPESFVEGFGLDGATFPLAMQLDGAHVCPSIDLATSDGSPAVDVGSRGVVAFDHAAIVVAPTDCSAGAVPYEAGAWLTLADGDHDPLSFPVDPATMAVVGSDPVDALQLGGLRLTPATVSFDVNAMGWSMGLDGTSSIADTPVDLAGSISADDEGLIQLVGTIPQLELGAFELDDVSVTVTTALVDDDGSDVPIDVSGTLSVLGDDVDVSMVGELANGAVASLDGLVDRRDYTLASDDRLRQVALVLAYTLHEAEPFTVTSIGATMELAGFGEQVWSMPVSDLDIGPDEFAGELEIELPADGMPETAVPGTYHLATGDLHFGIGAGETSGEVATLLAGFEATTTLKISRQDGTAQASATTGITLGLGDVSKQESATIELPLSEHSSYSVSTNDFRLRSMTGNLHLEFEPEETEAADDEHDSGVGHDSHRAAAGPWETKATYEVTAPECTGFWKSLPTLTGELFRTPPPKSFAGDENDGRRAVTYYELKGEVDPLLPESISMLATGDLPEIEVSNVVVPGHEPEDEFEENLGHGIEVSLSLSLPLFAAALGFSYYPAGCGISAQGFAMFSTDGGSGDAGGVLDNFSGSGVTTDLTSFLGSELESGELVAIRRLIKSHHITHHYEHASAEAKERADERRQEADEASRAAGHARDTRNEADAAQQEARQAHEQAERDRQAAQTERDRADAERAEARTAHARAQREGEYERAEERYEAATEAADAASARADTASAAAAAADAELEEGINTSRTLRGEVEEAEEETATNKAAAEKKKQAAQFYFRLGITTCFSVCDAQMRIDVSGSIRVPIVGPLAATIGLSVQADIIVEPYFEVDRFDVKVSGAIGIYLHWGKTFVSLSFDVEVYVEIELEVIPGRVATASRPARSLEVTPAVELGLRGRLTVGVHLLVVHVNATLASLELKLRAVLNPFPPSHADGGLVITIVGFRLSGSATIDFDPVGIHFHEFKFG